MFFLPAGTQPDHLHSLTAHISYAQEMTSGVVADAGLRYGAFEQERAHEIATEEGLQYDVVREQTEGSYNDVYARIGYRFARAELAIGPATTHLLDAMYPNEVHLPINALVAYGRPQESWGIFAHYGSDIDAPDWSHVQFGYSHLFDWVRGKLMATCGYDEYELLPCTPHLSLGARTGALEFSVAGSLGERQSGIRRSLGTPRPTYAVRFGLDVHLD